MQKTNVLVVGGSAAGIVTAVTGKSNYPDKDFLVIRKEKEVLVPCGIPYIFGSLDSSNKDVIPDKVLQKAGVNLQIAEVASINSEKKTCKTSDGTEIGFEKLVLALGSIPTTPKWLKGADLDNVYTVPKNKEHIDQMAEKLQSCEKIITVGAGFIGVEISDELNKRGKEVTLVEILPHILSLVFDEELAVAAEEILKSRGLNLKTGSGIKEILGNKAADGVLLNNGEKLSADAVILAMGYAPNTNFVKNCGIATNKNGFIPVDEYMRTENPDIFAVSLGRYPFSLPL